MTTSYSTEHDLNEMAEKLEREASALREAAQILAAIREDQERGPTIKALKERAKDWMKR